MTAEPISMTSPALAAIVPTFNPDAGFADRLRAVAAEAARVYVVDDGSRPEILAQVRAAAQQLGCTFMEHGANLGIAAAFNHGSAAARRDGCDLLLLLDQDTVVEPGIARQMAALITRPSPAPIAVLAANYRDPHGRLAHRLAAGDEVGDVPIAISAGSLIAGAAYDRLGGMDEALFIDEVDHDFCLRARLHGYRIAVTREAFTRHRIGQQKIYRLAGVTFSMSNHSPTRRYYMARNRVIMTRRYLRPFPGWVLGMLARSGVELLLLPCLEPDRRRKLRAVGLGLWHGLIGRAGRVPRAL